MISRLVDSALRPYSPGGKLNGFPATLRSRTAIGSSSLHRLRLGLPGCLVERYGVSQPLYPISNPVRSPSFHPSPSSAFWQTAFATGGLPQIKGFYPYLRSTVRLSRLLVLRYLLRPNR